MTHKDISSQGDCLRILNKFTIFIPNLGQSYDESQEQMINHKDMRVVCCATQFQGIRTSHSRDSEGMVKCLHHVVLQKILRINVM